MSYASLADGKVGKGRFLHEFLGQDLSYAGAGQATAFPSARAGHDECPRTDPARDRAVAVLRGGHPA